MSSIDVAGVKAQAKAVLAAVTGVSQVETKFGAEPEWAKAKRVRQSLWVVHAAGWEVDQYAPGHAEVTYHLQIEGYMPYSLASPDTTPAWDALQAAVGEALMAHQSLNGAVQNAGKGSPRVTKSDFATFASEKGPEVVCHHVTLEVDVLNGFTFSSD